MSREEEILCKHLKDLANACCYRNYPTASDFLNLNEQSLFLSIVKELPAVTYCLDGGYPLAERRRVIFSPTGVGDVIPAPLYILRIEPKSLKFADKLTHRDYLGALLNLGIVRGKIGDILVDESGCYVICTDEIGPYVETGLERVKHTPVTCQKTEQDQFNYTPSYEQIKGSVASERLDAVIGLAFHNSRSKMANLIKSEKVFVNGKQIVSASYNLKEGDVVSVRGFGKFIYDGMQSQTKKGRSFVILRMFC